MSRRPLVLVLGFGLAAAAVVAARPGVATAQKKGNPQNVQEAQLRQEVADLRQKVNSLQAELKKEKEGDKADATVKTQFDGMKNAGYGRTVVYRLKPDSAATEVQALIDDVPTTLGKIKGVRGA